LILRKGTSSEVKRQTFRINFLYLSLVIFDKFAFIVGVYDKYAYKRDLILIIAGNSFGTILAIARIIYEPYVLYVLKCSITNLLKIFGIKCNKIKKVRNESLCSLTNSALNIELVYIILTGIDSLMSSNLEHGSEVASM